MQPVNVELVYMSHGSFYSSIPVQATTDAQGDFVIRGISKLDPSSRFDDPRAAEYVFRVLDGSLDVHDRSAPVHAPTSTPANVRIANGKPEREETKQWGANAKISGRVLHNGRPLPDAEVMNFFENEPMYPARTNPDGRFELEVRADEFMALEVRHATGLSTTRKVELAPGQNLEGVTIDVGSLGRIDGITLDGAGRPRKNVTLMLVSRDTLEKRYAPTGPDGRFMMVAEVGHTYDLTATDDNTGALAKREIALDATHPNAVGLRVLIGTSSAINSGPR